LPGQDSHLLEQRTFARHTWITTAPWVFQAYDALEAALQENARYDRVRELLIDQYVKACHEKEALALVRDMADPGFPRKYIRDMIRGSVAAINKDWNQALELLQPAFMSGCRETLCMRYLTVVLLASGNPQAAEPVLAAWRAAQPSSDELPHYEAAVAEFLQAETQLNALEPGDRQIRIDSAQNTLRGISAPINSPANYQPPAHS